MKKILVLAIMVISLSSCDFSNYILEQDYDFTTVFEKTDGAETATYKEVIDFYEDLAAVYSSVDLQIIGETDSGEPLHLMVYSKTKNFDFESVRKDHTIVLINNGIHPG